MEFGFFARPVVTIYDEAAMRCEKPEGLRSTIGDEGLYGNICKALAHAGEQDKNGVAVPEGMVEICTFYGYHGYVKAEELHFASEGKARALLQGKFALVTRPADVLAEPAVAAIRLLSLERGCLIETLPERAAGEPDNGLPAAVEGWKRVRMADTSVGYMRSTSLRKVPYTQSAVFYLEEGRPFMEAAAMGLGKTMEQMVPSVLERLFGGSEDAFRESVIESAAQYLGTEYRWGGKTTRGIDCSGLASMSYLLNGVAIYRNAEIKEGWPVHEITLDNAKPADLLYFPGHVALYLGKGRYLHATGAAASGGVVVNSLDPADPLFRADLKEKLTAVGSIF